MTAATTAKAPSLRRRMLRQVLLPLGLTWLLGSALALWVASWFTQQAFDRALLDDAFAIDANVSAPDGQLALNLSPREVAEVLFDQSEKVFFAVLRADGSLVAGQGGLLAPAAAPVALQGNARPNLEDRRLDDHPVEDHRFEDRRFENRHYRGLDLRMVTLWRAQPVAHAVVVAQTTRSRAQLLERLLAASLAPQAVLLLLLGAWLQRSIGRELDPLAQLQQALDRRDSTDLAPVVVTAASRDIAHLAAAFNGLLLRIGGGVRAQREFAGNVAHELRTPLAGIRSLAEYGLAQHDPAQWQTQLRRIVASEARASHLIDQLLALALADEARDGLALQAVDVGELVQDQLLRLLPRADAAGVDLGAVGLEQRVCAQASVALLEGLLGNLIDNALRYGRPAATAALPRVTVEVAGQGAEVLLAVTDNGPGMDAAQCQRVLARWEQGAAGTQHGSGAGLGLAIVARYVALMGGRLSLDPGDDGRGLCVRVWLLRDATAPTPAPAPTPAHGG